MTIEQIDEQIQTDISSKSAPGSISPANVGDGITVVASELAVRGMIQVSDVDTLKTISPADTQQVNFKGRGIYKSVGVSDSLTNDYNLVQSPIANSPWQLVLPARRKGAFPEPFTKYFDFPGYVFTGGDDAVLPAENITYAGNFLSNAIPLLGHTGNYDKLSFSGGDRTSTATFNKYLGSDTNRRFRIRLIVDTLGSATSFVGVWLKNVNAANDAGTVSRGMYVDLNAGAIFRFVGGSHSDITAGAAGTVTWNGPAAASLGIAASGDDIEVIYETNGRRGQDILTVNNLTSGHSLVGTIDNMIFAQQAFNQFGNSATAPSIILAGVNTDYIFKGFDCESTIPSRPFLAIVGDSMASGYSVIESTSLYGKLNAVLQYNVAQFAGPGLYVNSQAQCMREITLMRAKYVFFFGWLAMYWGDFRDTDPDYATFYASWTKIMKSIRAAGGRPILAMYPPWPAGGQSGVSQPLWATFVQNEAATYDALVVDLSGHTFNYNGGAGFHLGDADNEFVKNELLKILNEAGAFADL